MEGGIFMNKNEQVAYQILEDFREGRKSRKQASLLLGVSERSVSRRVKKLREKGLLGIKHGNYQRPPKNKTSEALRREILSLIESKYFDFNTAHAHEILCDKHGYDISYMSLLGWCKEAGIGRKRKRRRPSRARIYRERMSSEGILLQMDGSRHKWNGKSEWHLISVIDDATSNIPAGKFYGGETSWNCMDLLRDLFTKRGIPEFLYTDGAGWAGGGAKRQNFSQVVRACEELGIKIIRANSAQAKGRIERSYKTIQDRLVPELRLHGIDKMDDANHYLEQKYWPEWSKKFTVEPRESPDRYRSLQPEEDLDEILCMKYERVVRSNHTVFYDNQVYGVKPGEHGNLRQKPVQIHKNQEGGVKIYYNNQKLEHKIIKPPKRRFYRPDR